MTTRAHTRILMARSLAERSIVTTESFPTSAFEPVDWQRRGASQRITPFSWPIDANFGKGRSEAGLDFGSRYTGRRFQPDPPQAAASS